MPIRVPRRRRPSLSVAQAAALGAIQGPAELLPVSSSGHLVLVPALLGWDYTRLDPHVRKSFEVALHGGSAAALALAVPLRARRALHVALTFLPPALAGYAFEEWIEERLGEAGSVAVAQIGGGVALWLADGRHAERSRDDARALDFLALGFAQVAALAPGVSRNGATVTAARLLGFDRPSANLLSWQCALPISAGAVVLKGARIAQRGMPRGLTAPFAAGTAAAFATGLVAARAARDLRSYRPLAAYRIALGAVVLARRRR